MSSSDDHIKSGRTLIIFPEGTRVPYGQNVKIKKGVLKILSSLKLSATIVNHDAGKFWSKKSF